MNKYDYGVASCDMNDYVDGLSELIDDHIDRGFKAYIMTFLFRNLPSSEATSKEVMTSEVRRVFGRFITEVVRNPWSKGSVDRRPVLIGCPDWPVPKSGVGSKHRVNGSGIHFAGILLVPRVGRLKTSAKRHFHDDRRSYVSPGQSLERIHLERIKKGTSRTVCYNFKSLLRRRCDSDDLLVLPDSLSERPS